VNGPTTVRCPTATELLSALKGLTQAKTLEEAWPMVLKQLAQYGFDRVFYAATQFRTKNDFGDLSDAVILTNYPPDYIKTFLGDEYYKSAPTIEWVSHNPGSAISWSHSRKALMDGALTPAQTKVMELNAKYNIKAGFTVSFPRLSQRSNGGIGVCSSHMSQDQIDALWQDKGLEIEVLCNLAHLKLNDLPYIGNRVLTTRQRDALEMVADGKTIQDIAQLWERNVATVEKHLRLAREALDVDTTAQAILKASLLNQVFISSSLR